MLDGSIRHNLTMWDNTIEEPRSIQAARDAVIHDDIAERSGGYDSWWRRVVGISAADNVNGWRSRGRFVAQAAHLDSR